MRLDFPNNSYIEADVIRMGKDFQIGKDVHIKVREQFRIGDFGRFGDDVRINAQSVEIGNHFFHYTSGLEIGGGGSQFPEAILTIGDRCVLHNNYINLACRVSLGNDVGLSPDVDIITHGFWQSIFEGYPAAYDEVIIGNGVIVGQRSTILMGANIADNVVVGASSVVTGELYEAKAIYAGNPAKFIRVIDEPSLEAKDTLLDILMRLYTNLPNGSRSISYKYPHIYLNNAVIDVIKKTIEGEEDLETDKLRDFLRRYGVRIYTDRPFISL